MQLEIRDIDDIFTGDEVVKAMNGKNNVNINCRMVTRYGNTQVAILQSKANKLLKIGH